MLSITKIKNSSKTTKYFAKDDYYTNNDSTIHNDHLSSHLISKNKILDNYKKKYNK